MDLRYTVSMSKENNNSGDVDPFENGYDRRIFERVDWREFRMADMLSVVNRALAPFGFSMIAEVVAPESELEIEERREVVTAMYPLRTVDRRPVTDRLAIHGLSDDPDDRRKVELQVAVGEALGLSPEQPSDWPAMLSKIRSMRVIGEE